MRLFKVLLKSLLQSMRFALTMYKVLVKSYYCSGIKRQEHLRSAALFANGPSLNVAINKYLNDESYKNVDIWVLNDFYKSEYFCKLKPRYYCLCDPGYFKDNPSNTIWQSFEKYVTWPITVFIPKNFYKSFKSFVHLSNKSVNIITYNMEDYHGFEKFRFPFYHKNYCSPHCETTSIAMIYIALTIGYKNLYLYGMEHSWLSHLCVRDDNILCHLYEHFDDKNKTEIKEVNPIGGHPWKIADFLDSQARMFHQHDILQKYSQYLGASIINCTPNSMITSYRRQPLKISK